MYCLYPSSIFWYRFLFQDVAADYIPSAPERLHRGRARRLEEEPGQEIRRRRGVLHLLLHPSRLQPPAAEAGLSDLQEEVPLCLPVQVVLHQQQLDMSSLQKSVLKKFYCYQHIRKIQT